MAIKKPEEIKQYKLIEEIASRALVLNREVTMDINGTIFTNFGCSIHPESITYETDEQGNKLDIYDRKSLPDFRVSEQQLLGLFSIQVTLQDGTQSYIGEILSNFADQIIAKQFEMDTTVDVITTQHIDISNIL